MSIAEIAQSGEEPRSKRARSSVPRLAVREIQLAVIGTGYVGLVSGACFAAAGIKTVCVDLNEVKLARLAKGETPIHEPGLAEVLKKAIRRGTISFTSDIARAVAEADGIIIAVGTPTDPLTGNADISAVVMAARQFAPHLKPNAFVIAKSTVPPGTNRHIARTILEAAPKARFHTVSNPEFLREGQAVHDFMNPDRIVVGVDAAVAENFMRDLYRSFGGHMQVVGVETAEIIKYASNAFLATKIAFINEIADLCEAAGADVRHVAEGMGLDPRIAPAFLNPGPGYGGSCFPKDTLALIAAGRRHAAPQTIVTAVAAANEERKKRLSRRIQAALGGELAGRRIALLGLAFKPGTDDVRDSPAIDLIEGLSEAGAVIAAHDPEAADHPTFAQVTRFDHAMQAIQDADAIVIVTEWPQYRALNMGDALRRMRGNLVVDLRNALNRDEMRRIGFSYLGIGLGTAHPVGPVSH